MFILETINRENQLKIFIVPLEKYNKVGRAWLNSYRLYPQP